MPNLRSLATAPARIALSATYIAVFPAAYVVTLGGAKLLQAVLGTEPE